MTFLRSVRLKGFKTFARPTELDFEPGVTVIIGPNGSGKSNIADAVLWALGEQSPTSLRGRTMQDVIFSGTDGRRPGALAEVGLVFENNAGMFPVDYAEVEISRRLLRDGSSEYRLNGSACRLLDIQELVAGAGLGREMHSVISQGKVDELVNSTSQSRRALVEEAAGLGHYKKRRDRALAKLDRVRVNLERVSAVEREVRGVLRPLKLQVTAAERFAQATEELAVAQTRRSVRELLDLRREIGTCESRVAATEDRRRETEEVLAGVRAERAREEESFAAALLERERVSELFHAARAGTDRLRSRAGILAQRVARSVAEATRATRRREAAEEELGIIQAGRSAFGDAPIQSVSRLERVTQAALSVTGDLDELRPRFEAAVKADDDRKDGVFELETARSRLVQEREFLRRQVDEQALRARELAAREQEAEEGVAALAASVQAHEATSAETLRSAEVAAAAAAAAADAARRAEAAHREAIVGVREEQAVLEAVSARTAVLRDVCVRREGLPKAARTLLGASPGAALVTEVVNVRAGFERAVVVALGPLASAVIVSGSRDVTLVRDADGPVEIVWPGGLPSPTGRGGTVPAGADGTSVPAANVVEERVFLDLWEVVEGPPEVLGALRALVPPTVLAAGPYVTEDRPDVASGIRVVYRDGQVRQGTLHGARRGEAGAEALLAARAELEAREEERAARAEVLEGLRAAVAAAEAEVAVAAAAATAQETAARETARAVAAAADQLDVLRRRLGDAESRMVEVRARRERDQETMAAVSRDLVRVAGLLDATGDTLDQARHALRAGRDEVESLRGDLSRLEGKRAQATLLQVRLKERLRAEREQHERAEARHAALMQEVLSARRQEQAWDRLTPTLHSLHAVAAAMADRFEELVSRLQRKVELSRESGDDFSRVLKDLGQREADLQNDLAGEAERLIEAQVSLAHMSDKAAERERALAELRSRHLGPRTVTEDDVRGLAITDLAATEARLQRRLDAMGPVNPLAEQEYRETEERAGFLAEQRRDLEASLDELSGVIADLDGHIESTFSEMFSATQKNFADMVQLLFPGGRGVLRLEEPRSPEGSEDLGEPGEREAAGIVLEIKPPRKAPRSMSLLSGGEKALAALSFLFALFLARPCPFYVLDEVEAALDDMNLGRFLTLVKRYQNQTQFIIITHQRRTMEIADTIYGVAMDADGTSRVLSRRLSVGGAAQS